MSKRAHHNFPLSGIDSTGDYLNKVGAVDLIDGEKEIELALAIRVAIEAQEILQLADSDPSLPLASLTSFSREDLEAALSEGYTAREEFIEANLRLVAKLAGKYVGVGVDRLELIQEGNIALIGAVNDFDPDLGNKFSTFVYDRIRSAMLASIPKYGRTVRVPIREHNLSNSYQRIKQEVKSEDPYLRDSEIREICAERLGCSAESLRELEGSEWSTSNPRSIDAPIGDEGSGLSLSDVIGFEDQTIGVLHDIDFDQLTEGLNERQKTLLRLRVYEDQPLSAVADILSISRERVRQLESKILATIRGRMVRGELTPDLQQYPRIQRVINTEQDQFNTLQAASRIIPNIHKYGSKKKQ